MTTVDEDQQEVVVDEPGKGEFFGFAPILEQTPHQTGAVALEDSVCIEVSRSDFTVLLERRPHAGMESSSSSTACAPPNPLVHGVFGYLFRLDRIRSPQLLGRARGVDA